MCSAGQFFAFIFFFFFVLIFNYSTGLYSCEWHSDRQPFNHVIWDTTEDRIHLQWRYPKSCAVQYYIRGMKSKVQGTTMQNEVSINHLEADHLYELVLECLFCVRNRHAYRSPPYSIQLRTKALHPPPPSHIAVINTTRSSLCVAWRAPLHLRKGEFIENYFLMLSTRSPDNSAENWEFNISSISQTLKCVTGLPAGVGFNVVMRLSTNQNRFSNHSKTVFAKTRDGLSGPVVTYLVRPVETGPMWISLFWRPPLRSNGIVFMYLLTLHDENQSTKSNGQCLKAMALKCTECYHGEIQFGNPEFSSWRKRLSLCGNDFSSIPIVGQFSHSARILSSKLSSLRPHTRYMIRIYPVNRAGLGSVQVLKAKTNPLDQHSIHQLKVFPKSSRTIGAQWRASRSDVIVYFVSIIDEVTMDCKQSLVLTCENCGETILTWSTAKGHYNDLLHYCNTKEFLDFRQQDRFFNVTLPALSPFSRYEVNIYSLSGTQLVGKNSVVTVTQQDIPGVPQNVTFSESSGATLTISWKPPFASEQNGIIRKYDIFVTSPNSNYQLWNKVLAPAASVVVLNGVLECNIYCVQVWAETSVGRGNGSRPVCHNQIVSETPPMKLKDINFQHDAQPKIKVSWKEQKIGNCSVGYIVKLRQAENQIHFFEKVTTSKEITFSNLSSGRDYQSKIRYFTGGMAQSNFKLSPWSKWSSIISLPKQRESIIGPAMAEVDTQLKLSCNQTVNKCYAITCNWLGVEAGNITDAFYEIAYRRDLQVTWDRFGLKYEPSNIYSYEITRDLIPGELYTISLELRINNLPSMTAHSLVQLERWHCDIIQDAAYLKNTGMMVATSCVAIVLLILVIIFLCQRRARKRLSLDFSDTSEMVYQFTTEKCDGKQ